MGKGWHFMAYQCLPSIWFLQLVSIKLESRSFSLFSLNHRQAVEVLRVQTVDLLRNGDRYPISHEYIAPQPVAWSSSLSLGPAASHISWSWCPNWVMALISFQPSKAEVQRVVISSSLPPFEMSYPLKLPHNLQVVQQAWKTSGHFATFPVLPVTFPHWRWPLAALLWDFSAKKVPVDQVVLHQGTERPHRTRFRPRWPGVHLEAAAALDAPVAKLMLRPSTCDHPWVLLGCITWWGVDEKMNQLMGTCWGWVGGLEF